MQYHASLKDIVESTAKIESRKEKAVSVLFQANWV